MKNTENIPFDSSLSAAYAAIEKQPIIIESTITQRKYRINRNDFFQYVVILFILTTIIYFLVAIFFPNMSSTEIKDFNLGNPITNPHIVLIANLSWLLVYGTFYWILMRLCIQRYADFGNTGKTPKILIPIFFIMNIYAYGLGIYSAYFGNPIMKHISIDSPLYYIISNIGILTMSSFICIVIMVLYCLIRPGKNIAVDISTQI